MKIAIKIIISACLILLCNTNIYAQDDSVAERIGDLPQFEISRDTCVNNNVFKTELKIQVYRKDKEFAYMKYLDSLLRQTKDLTVDTFSIGNINSIKRRKNASENSDRKISKPKSNIFSQPLVKIILWILAALLIGFIIYKLFLVENFF